MKRLRILWVAAALFAASPRGAHPQDAQAESHGAALTAYLKGVYLESESDFYNAYQYYLYAAAREPNEPRIGLRLARVALEVGDFESAKEHAEKLVAHGDYVAEARIILSEAEYRLGNKEVALKVLTALRGMSDVPQVEVLHSLARVYVDLKRNDEARRALEEASALPDADFSIFYELGILDAQAGKNALAIEALGKAVAINPDFTNAHLARGELFTEMGNWSEAEHSLKEALRIEPDNKNAMRELEALFERRHDDAAAAELLAPLHRAGTLDEEGELHYARFLDRAGKTDEALTVLDEIVKKEGEKPPLLRGIVEIEVEKGRFKTALEWSKKLLAVEPDRFENYIGILLMLSGGASASPGPDEAVTFTEEERRAYLDGAAAKVNPRSPANNYVMGSVFRKVGEIGRAEQFLLKAEKLDGKDENTLLEIASLYDRAGRYDEALKRVVLLYRNDPENASIANFYGYLLAEKGEKLDFAETLLGKALAKEPDNGYFLDSLGWIRFKEGRIAEALDILLKAAGKKGNDAVIWEHVGDAYARLNEPSKAREAYLKSLAIDPKSKGVDEKLGKLKPGE